jgi:hypothetical protein
MEEVIRRRAVKYINPIDQEMGVCTCTLYFAEVLVET